MIPCTPRHGKRRGTPAIGRTGRAGIRRLQSWESDELRQVV
ncbi:hypothetical protein FRUB_05836 [Fimbriiglobus ruber]|uniref:Uncharacterized protein n=1 Tax=Fimbriiglobus ruber TaxID=1908690 RepID=A0A225DQX8_9BACT|nr:hypothetical protein FRUB_05836 [Fimbriiglobus ruber]